MSTGTAELIRPNTLAVGETMVAMPVVAPEADSLYDDRDVDAGPALIDEGYVDAFVARLASMPEAQSQPGQGYGEYVAPREQKGLARVRTAVASVALKGFGLVSGLGVGDGSNPHRAMNNTHRFRAGLIAYGALNVAAGFLGAYAGAKGFHISSIPGLDAVQYISASHNHAAGAHDVLASNTLSIPPTAGGNGGANTVHTQLLSYDKPAPRTFPSPTGSPTGTEATPAPTTTVSPTTAPTGVHPTGPQLPTPGSTGGHHHALTPPATGAKPPKAPAVPATGTVSVHEFKPGTKAGIIDRQWAEANPKDPTALGSPRDALFFEHDKNGNLTIDLRGATKNTLLPNGKHLTSAQLHGAKVVITFDSSEKNGKLTQHVVELNATDGKLTLGPNAAKLIDAGDYKTVEMSIPGAGKDGHTHIITLSTVANDHEHTVNAGTMIDDLRQPAATKPAAGGTGTEQLPTLGAKPTAVYGLSLDFDSSSPHAVATISGQNMLTADGHTGFKIPFNMAPVPQDLKIPAPTLKLPLNSDELKQLGQVHLSHHQGVELNTLYKTDATNLRNALKAQGLQPVVIDHKTGQIEQLHSLGQLKAALEQGDQVKAIPLGDTLGQRVLVTPEGWKLNVVDGKTIAFTAPNGSKVDVAVPADAFYKNGNETDVDYTKLKEPIVQAFSKQGLKVEFPKDDTFNMTITPGHAAAGQGATPGTPTPTRTPSAPATEMPSTPATTPPASPSATPSSTPSGTGSPTTSPTPGAGSASPSPSTSTSAPVTAPATGGASTPPAVGGHGSGDHNPLDDPLIAAGGAAGVALAGLWTGRAIDRRHYRRSVGAASRVTPPATAVPPVGVTRPGGYTAGGGRGPGRRRWSLSRRRDSGSAALPEES